MNKNVLPETGNRDAFKQAVLDTLEHWGIYDVQDKCWLGDSKGPLVYSDKLMASAAATIVNEQFGHLARFRPALYWEKADRRRDEIVPLMTAEEALKRIESRDMDCSI